jgi:hypothetical protein
MADQSEAESHAPRSPLRIAVSILAIAGAAAIGGVLLFAASRDILGSAAWLQIAHDHFAATIGLPAAAFTSLFVVLFLEVKSGRVEFEAWGLKFRGASGEVVLFVFVFLAIAIAIKVLW